MSGETKKGKNYVGKGGKIIVKKFVAALGKQKRKLGSHRIRNESETTSA